MSTQWTRRILVAVVIMGLGSVATAFAAKVKPKKEAPPPPLIVEPEAAAFPPAELTVGLQARDSETEGIGDLLIPVWNPGGNGLLFLNPRTAITDHDGEEANLGVGYRQLFPKWNVILGINAFYDYRDTGLYNYHQWGFGLECLSPWLDARFNYYDPEDKTVLAAQSTETSTRQEARTSRAWEDPYAFGHEVRQNLLTIRQLNTITTTHTYEQFEQPYGGHDWEIGLRLPIPCDGVEARLFGGYYSFDRDFGGSAHGWKGRAEIRLRSTLFLDAGLYENDRLTGSDWYLGARLTTPLDLTQLARGRNPFATAKSRWSGQSGDLASRLTEMVMRDPQIRLEQSKFVENPQLLTETVTTKKTTTRQRHVLLSDVQFVNGDAPAGGDGTGAHPFQRIQQGADAVFGTRHVYVFHASGPYNENVVLQAGTTLWGSGALVPGYGGKTFGSGIAPVVDGNNLGPAITMANQTTVKGFSIRNTDHNLPHIYVLTPCGNQVDISRAGIWGPDVTDLTITQNLLANNGYGILLSRLGSFRLNITDNTVEHNFNGLDICAVGSGSTDTSEITLARNTVQHNEESGLFYQLRSYDRSLMSITDSIFNHNNVAIYGIQLETVDAQLLVQNMQVKHNLALGLVSVQAANTNSLANISGSSFDNNGFHGIYLQQYSFENSIALIGAPAGLAGAVAPINGALAAALPTDANQLLASAGGVTANQNGDTGITVYSYAINGLACGGFFDITANENGEAGFNGQIASANGSAMGLGGGTAAWHNFLQLDQSVSGMGQPSRALGNGQMQLNNNGANGLNLYVDGQESAVTLLAGITANANGGTGIEHVTSSYGLSTAAVLDSHANQNQGDGIRLAAYAAEGDASVILASTTTLGNLLTGMGLPEHSTAGPTAPCTASGNQGVGLNINGEAYDNMLAVVSGIQADGNGAGGILMYLESEGDIFTLLADAQTSTNAGFGASLHLDAEQNAMAAIVNSRAAENNGRGYELTLNAAHGDALALLGGVTANNNHAAGIWGALTASAPQGNAAVVMSQVTSLNNSLRRGAHFEITGGASASLLTGLSAWNDYADHELLATIIPQGQSEFSHNGLAGLQAELTTAGEAWLSITDITASSNANAGLNFTVTASGIMAAVSNAAAHGNNGGGLAMSFAGAASAPDDSLYATIQDSQFTGNDGNGINLVSSYDGPVGVGGWNNLSANNSANGIRLNLVNGGPYTVDFGGGGLGSIGQNSFYGNANRDFRINGGVTTKAQSNWWGQVPPVAGQFAGSVDWTDWLLTDPTP